MKSYPYCLKVLVMVALVSMMTACHDLLEEAPENTSFVDEADYTQSENMIVALYGAYERFYTRGWEDIPLISVRGDDVNAGGLGDQQDYNETDQFRYNKDYWMYNSVWQNHYNDIWDMHSAMEQIALYKEYAPNPAVADQYIAEIKVMRGFLLFQLARVWGDVFVTPSSDPSDLLIADLTPRDEVLQHISDQMDEAIPHLPNLRPNERTDIRGGVTRFTALAVKALANLELKNYQAVADATSAIISSNRFTLYPDYYQLFKIPGKLANENLLELQYSDFGQGSGDQKSYLFAFFGPQNWTPAVAGAGGGWGFYEPSIKYITFMMERGESTRLETSVLFTNRGIDSLETLGHGGIIPEWVSNVTPSGDRINDYPRAIFASGKHYLPTEQLTPGRTGYGNNKNFIVIRYAEILLMHAEALTHGASGTGMTAVEAVNAVRTRADMAPLGSVTLDDVMDEKFAELGMEWGTRYYDMIRLGRTEELSYADRVFSADKTFLPYPQLQVDVYPVLKARQ